MELALLITAIALACVLPIATITAVIIGYNVNADRKIMQKHSKKKSKPTADEIMLERIDKATV